jgi:hypothetical protein
MEAEMDHGLLNLPLSKRGNINAEIDRYKATEAKARRDRQRLTTQQRKAASAALNNASDASLQSLAGKLGLTVAATRRKLHSECISSPQLVLRFLGEVA